MAAGSFSSRPNSREPKFENGGIAALVPKNNVLSTKQNMHQTRRYWLLIIFIISSVHVSAQTVREYTGWFAWSNSYRFSEHWGLHFDAQVRSADDWDNVRTTIFRPGITYFLDARNSATLGYAYITTYNRLTGSTNTMSENRLWEQYVNNTKFGQVSLQNRFRLEQRFIERPTGNQFAQRLRYFVRTIIPLSKQKSSFNKGFFAAIQNEIFLNVQNKDKINGSFFDQNRIYSAIGYRFNPKVDLEAGYMYQYVNGMNINDSNNIIQMALYTRF